MSTGVSNWLVMTAVLLAAKAAPAEVPAVPAAPTAALQAAPREAAAAGFPGSKASPPPLAAQPAGPVCAGDYADNLSTLSAKAREFEQSAPAYTFCVRTTATYECPSYGSDGAIRRSRRKSVAHGTGFAYRVVGGETLLLTNDHVAEWPAITDADHPVDDVPAGCKRVADSLSIVDNEGDDYDRDDIPLSRVVVDPELDIGVLKAKQVLPVIPWRVGHSKSLRERNAVDVRGFPLGLFKATNEGRVISAWDHDTYKDWDHDDFVIDAPLSQGNSGSPVLAVSCATGELELVGVFHAGYAAGSSLNVAIGIDQVRDLMTTLHRTPHTHPEAAAAPDAQARAHLLAAAQAEPDPFFSFGPLAAAVRARADGALIFELFGHDFPFSPWPALVLEDLPPAAPDQFGTPGRSWAGNEHGLRPLDHAALDAEDQGLFARLLEALRRDGSAAFEWRSARPSAATSRDRYEQTARQERTLRKTSAARQELAQAALDLADREAPDSGEATGQLAVILAPPRIPPPSPAPPGAPAPPSGAPAHATPVSNVSQPAVAVPAAFVPAQPFPPATPAATLPH